LTSIADAIMQTMTLSTAKTRPDLSNEERWAAVVRRDASSDGQFFYSVSTTGIYCRPSCPSRLAKRENVAFHDTGADAERAGFRPCKRCRPDEAPLAKQHAAMVAQICELIEAADNMPNLAALAQAAGMSRYHFHRIFKALTSMTPKAYAAAHRGKRVRDRLVCSNTITAAIYDAGFNSNGRFYATSSHTLGMTPTSYRNGGARLDIRFAVGQCSLGAILVAATGKGVCAILIDDDPEFLVRDLQDRFPHANLIGGDRYFEQMVAQVIGLVEKPTLNLDLPLDLRGTIFQQRIWQALRGIPAGSTISYTELAKRIGAPKAVRAVAQACAANPVAIAVPCHRVVRSDGALSGYRWGIDRKRMLLEREQRKDTDMQRE
jgi:AraC family transcriptional regulator of adaptative response/methylated-DNA-[protein]-cysteine methyltransferase